MWSSVVGGRRLRFRLAGINNQNFIMQDEETGTWWQQVTGRAILGPMRGAQLALVPHDEVSFEIWRAEHPSGTVLAPDPAIEAIDEYAPPDWERRMAKARVVTELPAGSPFAPRTLVVGVTAGSRSKAYPLHVLRESRVLLDVVGDVPVLLMIAEDGRSVRVFDRRVDGHAAEFVAVPGTGRPVIVDLDTASEWDFGGTAMTGRLRGRRLARVPHLVEYWFDWQTYRPATDVYKPWRPTVPPADRLEIPRPASE